MQFRPSSRTKLVHCCCYRLLALSRLATGCSRQIHTSHNHQHPEAETKATRAIAVGCSEAKPNSHSYNNNNKIDLTTLVATWINVMWCMQQLLAANQAIVVVGIYETILGKRLKLRRHLCTHMHTCRIYVQLFWLQSSGMRRHELRCWQATREFVRYTNNTLQPRQVNMQAHTSTHTSTHKRSFAKTSHVHKARGNCGVGKFA